MKRWCRALIAWTLGAVLMVSTGESIAQTVLQDLPINSWLQRMHEASRQRTYTGTLVVSAGGNLVSAKIWHACDGSQQVERVETLTGSLRSIFRRNDQVVTFFPESKVAIVETRASLGLFPDLLKTNNADIAEFYQLEAQGSERIAGFDADVVRLSPKDGLRFGYLIWSEKKTGLVLQLQTLDLDGRVLERSAFSELQLNAPVSIAKLSQMMANTQGYRVERPELQKASPEAHGWSMPRGVAGFKSVGCYERSLAPADGTGQVAGSLQWMFSDGLATVSLFVENFDNRRHLREGLTSMGGATHTLTRRIQNWWLTVVGEVPPATLKAFAQGLEHQK